METFNLTRARMLVALSIVIAVAIFALSIRDELRYPAADLRCKIVGARLLLAHRTLYPRPASLEPDAYYRMFKANTYTPALLLLYTPLNPFPYPVQRNLYFAIDWLCVAYLFLQTRAWFPPSQRVAHCVLFTLFLITDYALRLHLVQGQYYLALAALIAAAVSALRKPSSDSRWTSPFLLATLLLLRPSCFILLPVLWIQGFRLQVKHTLLVCSLIVLAMFAAFGPQPWADYLRTMENLQQSEIVRIFSPQLPPPSATSQQEPPATIDLSNYTKVEGEDYSHEFATNYGVSRSSVSLCSVQNAIRPVCQKLFKSPAIFGQVNTGLLLLAIAYSLLIAHALRKSPPEMKLGFALLTPLLIETFGPRRYAYSDVTLAPILMLIGAILISGRYWRRPLFRAVGVLVLSICILTSIAPWFLSPTNKPILALSLIRWTTLFAFANAVFLLAALRPETVAPPTSSSSSTRNHSLNRPALGP